MSNFVIRKATIEDIKEIQALINTFAEQDLMLPRSINELYENLRDYWVAVDAGFVIGCCALHVSWENLAEVKSLAVNKEFWGKAVGTRLIEVCLDDALELGIHQVFALTYQQGFFEKMGFSLISKEQLPHKIWSECIKCSKFPDCDEIAMMKEV